MLKLVMFLCVVQLGAATRDMAMSNFDQKFDRWRPTDRQGAFVERRYLETKSYKALKQMAWEIAEDYYKMAVAEKEEIEQEEESPKKAEKLQLADEKILERKKSAKVMKSIYDDAVLAKEGAKNDVLKLWSKLGL